MQRDALKHLYDIKESIDSIYEYLGPKRDFESYKTNKLLRRAVERELEIIGEATNRILKTDKNINISNARRIVDLRNWVIFIVMTLLTIRSSGASYQGIYPS